MEKIINEIRIDVPEGMEAYLENNTIKFRTIKKELTYDDIAKELFKDKKTYYTDAFCNIKAIKAINDDYNNINNCTSKKQAEKLIAINQLMNVAKYLNGDWQSNWEEHNNEFKWYMNLYHEIIDINYTTHYNGQIVYFKSKELAEQAISILGEETIRLALCTDW